MPLILGRSGTQYVAMVTKLLSSYCGAPLAKLYPKKINICYELAEVSFFIIFDQNLVEYMMSSLGSFAYFKNLNISGMKRAICKKVNGPSLLIQTTWLCFKMTSIGKV